MYNIELAQFSGPYDLLLSLIEEKKLTITEISLASVTEQYLSHLDKFSESDIDTDELLGFIAVAARLLYLKSQELLPVAELDDEEVSLEEHLKLYKLFQDATVLVQKQIEIGCSSYGSLPSKCKEVVIFLPPKGLTQQELSDYCQKVFDSLPPIIRLPQLLLEKAVLLKDRVDQVYLLLRSSGEINFKKLLGSSVGRLDLIISFLAIIELVNQQKIIVEQSIHFDDIILKSI